MTILETARDAYVKEFLKTMRMPKEAWIWETAYRGLNEEFEKIELKDLHPERDRLLRDAWDRQEGHQNV